MYGKVRAGDVLCSCLDGIGYAGRVSYASRLSGEELMVCAPNLPDNSTFLLVVDIRATPSLVHPTICAPASTILVSSDVDDVMYLAIYL